MRVLALAFGVFLAAYTPSLADDAQAQPWWKPDTPPPPPTIVVPPPVIVKHPVVVVRKTVIVRPRVRHRRHCVLIFCR